MENPWKHENVWSCKNASHIYLDNLDEAGEMQSEIYQCAKWNV